MGGILEGVRVLDFGRYIAGPYCAALLADLGAEVVRVESPRGGDDRYLMPLAPRKEGAMFFQCNRGKKAMTLDMSKPEAKGVIRRMIPGADVVIANLSASALRHLGLDYGTLKALREDIILTTVSAFGSEGPLAEKVGFDGVGQALSGAVYLTGEPGRPYRSATAYVDYSTALSCAFGTAAALLHRQRTGEGMHVQASLTGTALNITNSMLMEEATGANRREPMGNRSPIAGPSDVFRARDGWFIMQVIGQTMFRRWARLVGRTDLLDDPRFADDQLRGRNGAVLSEIAAAWAAERTREACLVALGDVGIAASEVLSPNEVVTGAQGLMETFFHSTVQPGIGGVPVAKPPVQLSAAPVDSCGAHPGLGQHTDEVLGEFGFTRDEIGDLRRREVI